MAETRSNEGGWPWRLDGDDDAQAWTLGDAMGDPLFGLPALPTRDLPPVPFRRLRPFTAADAEIFFGRGCEIRDVVDRLVGPPEDPPLALLYGESGVGKSSLIRAGVVPRVEAFPATVRYCRRGPAGLRAALADALVERICEYVGGNLTRDEWRDHVSETLPYEETCPGEASAVGPLERFGVWLRSLFT